MLEIQTPAQLNEMYRKFWAERAAKGEIKAAAAIQRKTADSASPRVARFVGRYRTHEPPTPLLPPS